MVASPCVNVCRMEDGLCAGCLRSIDEIAVWGNAGDNEKQRILAAVAQRRARIEQDLACNRADGG